MTHERHRHPAVLLAGSSEVRTAGGSSSTIFTLVRELRRIDSLSMWMRLDAL